MQSPPFGNSRHRVTRLLRSPLLRLKQIDVSASSDVERVPLRAQQMPLLAHQRQVAATDGADEHLPSITGGAVEEIQKAKLQAGVSWEYLWGGSRCTLRNGCCAGSGWI